MELIINTHLVIFDLDGTLCDTFNDIYLSLKYTLDSFDIVTPPPNDVKSFIGDGLVSLMEQTLNVTNKINLKDNVMFSFMQYYQEHCYDNTLLFSGMKNVLEKLQQSNINMAVVSNKAYNLVNIIIKQLGLYKYFKFIYGGDSFNEKKPSPKPLLSILDGLDILPNNAFMIGDSDNDIMAGKSAGLSTIYCSYGYAPLKKSAPDYIVNNPIDILNIVL